MLAHPAASRNKDPRQAPAARPQVEQEAAPEAIDVDLVAEGRDRREDD